MTLSSTELFTIVQPTVPLADPHVLSDIRDRRSIIDALFDSLVRRDADGRFTPWLATGWSVSADGLRWRFQLRDGVRCHDGSVLTAVDAERSLLRAISPEMPGELGTQGVLRSYLQHASILAEGSHGLTITLSEPFADLLDLLVDIPLLPAHALPALPQQPVGSGPYRLEAFEPGRLTLRAFADHWAGAPPAETLVWLAEPDALKRQALFDAGQADILVDPPFSTVLAEPANAAALNVPAESAKPSDSGKPAKSIESAESIESIESVESVESVESAESVESIESARPVGQILSQQSYLCIIFLFNLFAGATTDRRVRQALNHAVNLQAIIAHPQIAAGHALPLAGPLTARHDGVPPAVQPYRYDPALARQLLAEAGYANGLRLDLALPARFPDESIVLAQQVAADLLAVGVEATLTVYEDRPAYAQRVRDKQFGDIACFDSSPASGWRVWREKLDSRQQGPWWQGYHSEAVNTLLDRAAAADPQQHDRLLGEAFAIVHEDAPWLFLYAPHHRWAIGPRASGWQPSAEGRVRVTGGMVR